MNGIHEVKSSILSVSTMKKSHLLVALFLLVETEFPPRLRRCATRFAQFLRERSFTVEFLRFL